MGYKIFPTIVGVNQTGMVYVERLVEPDNALHTRLLLNKD